LKEGVRVGTLSLFFWEPMRRIALLLLLSLGVACDDSLSPSDIEGRFGMASANGLALPAAVLFEEQELLAQHGFIDLEPDGTLKWELYFTGSNNGNEFTYSELNAGRWTVDDGTLTFTDPGGGPDVTARLSDDGKEIALTKGGVDFIFRSAPLPTAALTFQVGELSADPEGAGFDYSSAPGSIHIEGLMGLQNACPHDMDASVRSYLRRIEIRIEATWTGAGPAGCSNSSGEQQYIADVTDLEAGPYHVTLISDNGPITSFAEFEVTVPSSGAPSAPAQRVVCIGPGSDALTWWQTRGTAITLQRCG
jgi:hypothetical protein